MDLHSPQNAQNDAEDDARDSAPSPDNAQAALIDNFGRQVTYLRVSVTDRCDFRCTYCMAENMKFLPKKDVLSFEELNMLIDAFVARGVTKVRLTGGEPLVRRDIMDLMDRISTHLDAGRLQEITLTTNGSQLAKHAHRLVQAGVRRINVSLDTLDPQKFARITRRGRLEQVLAGIDAAAAAGLAIKLNMVAMKGFNDSEIVPLMKWAHGCGFDLTLIEEMPMGEVSQNRSESFLPLRQVRDDLAENFTLEKIGLNTGGPARYVQVKETGGRVGFITPMSHNFCESCNRVRLTCTGQLYLCLGRDGRVDLRAALRENGAAGLNAALDHAMDIKPKGHDFDPARQQPAVSRHMSATGG